MLIHELPEQGQWLFRHRSFVPLLLVPFGIAALYLNGNWFPESPRLERLYELICFLVALSGLVIRGLALGYAQSGSSGRNTREQIADHLNITGLYSVVRHPLYLGNILIILGVLLFTQSPFFVIAGVLGYILFYERIIAAEERFLFDKFGESFRSWAAQTPALLPRFSRWIKPGIPFSLRTAIKGEFYGFTAIVAAMTFMKLLAGFFADWRFHPDTWWLALLGVSLVLFFTLRHLRKHTRFFERTSR